MSAGKAGLEALLEGARAQEEEFNWSEAAKTYGTAATLVLEEDLHRTGDVLERQAYALYKRALQSENVDEFRPRADDAVGRYARAKEVYEKAGGPEAGARSSRCLAMRALIALVRSSGPAERKEAAEECWKRASEALDGFASTNSALEFCKTFNDLFIGAIYSAALVPDFPTRKKYSLDALNYGEKAVALSRNIEDAVTTVRTLAVASSLWERSGYTGFVDEKAQTYHKKAVDYWTKAEAVSKNAALEALPLAYIVGDALITQTRDNLLILAAFESALGLVRRTRDRMLIGHALAGVSFFAHWISNAEDKEESDALLQKALDSAIEARDEFSKIGFMAATGTNIWVMSPHAGYFWTRSFYENDLEKKREFAERGMEAASEYERLAEISGFIWHIAGTSGLNALLSTELAKTESDIDRKRSLQADAVEQAKKSLASVERWDAGSPLNLGAARGPLALALGRLAELTVDTDSKIRALKEAIATHKRAYQEFVAGIELSSLTDDPTSYSEIGQGQMEIGRLHRTLYDCSHDPSALTDAAACYELSAELCMKAEQPTRAAESLWEAARVYDELEDPAKAADRFASASDKYRSGAEAIPRLKDLYINHAVYLEAWAEFEEAKRNHAQQEYQQARDHFERAAELHEGLPKWRFLSSNYRAWALVDSGEAASREDRYEEAERSFTEASALFRKSKASLEEAGRGVEEVAEGKMIARLLTASVARRQYCEARTIIEKARQMNVEGKHSKSREMYEQAAEKLEKLAGSAPSEEDRREMKLIAVLSRAWQKMNQAEAQFSAEPYEEAAALFEEAKDLSENEGMRALALGHSRFCKALGAGTKFTDTRDPTLHATAKKHLESASSYYLKAGADVCSEYARASKLLFDAYAYLDEASQERDHKAAAKMYAAAEKVLRASSESYAKAGQPGKRDQVLKLLEKVEQDRDLSRSLMQALEAPVGVSSTKAFGALTPTLESAVGVERFEHADVRATIIGRPVDLRVGEDFDLEIELVNAGRGAAQLTKVEKIVPQGFDVKEIPERYRMEDSFLNLKGRRLDPLKTEDVRMVLKPNAQGRFTLRPRIMYLDETGKYKSHEPEPVDVVVKELGITGWLKGPESKRPR